MLKITSFDRRQGSCIIWMELPEAEAKAEITVWQFMMHDGLLESYMESYGLMPGEALELMLLDWYDDDVEVPPYLQEGMREVVEEILTKVDQIDWSAVDRNEILAQITVTEDKAPELVAQWRETRRRNEEAVAAHLRAAEERKAAAFVDDLPASVRAQPKDTDQVQYLTGLGLAIQIVD